MAGFKNWNCESPPSHWTRSEGLQSISCSFNLSVKFLFPGILCIFIDFWYGQRVHWQSSMTTRQFPSRTPGHPFPIPLLQASLHSLPEIRSSSKIYSIALVPQMVY